MEIVLLCGSFRINQTLLKAEIAFQLNIWQFLTSYLPSHNLRWFMQSTNLHEGRFGDFRHYKDDDISFVA